MVGKGLSVGRLSSQRLSKVRAAPVGCFIGSLYLYSASRPPPERLCRWARRPAILRIAVLAACDYNTSDSPESGGRRHPHAPAAIPRSARLRPRWRRKHKLRSEKIPATSGRSGQPPPTGWLRHSAVLVSSRRTADPVPLGTPADLFARNNFCRTADPHPFRHKMKWGRRRLDGKNKRTY